jgi:hypothetical protein
MENSTIVETWQKKIAVACAEILGRPLIAAEANFINAHRGFLALESIEVQVLGLRGNPEQLARYLSSESRSA